MRRERERMREDGNVIGKTNTDTHTYTHSISNGIIITILDSSVKSGLSIVISMFGGCR